MSQPPSSRSVSSAEAVSRLREKAAPSLLRAFDAALTRTEQWLEQFAAKQTDKDLADSTAKDRDALRQGRRAAGAAFEQRWLSAVSELMLDPNLRRTFAGLSLIDDESLDLQLAHESFVESVARRYRAGIEALDQRLALVLGVVPMGAKMPLAADILATAASAGIKEFEVEAAIRGLAFRHFDEALTPVLPGLLKDLNGWLAAAGVLPHLVVPDLEERHRPAARTGNTQDDDDEVAASGPGAATAEAGSAAHQSAGPSDRAMFETLIGLLQSVNAQRGATPAAGADAAAAGSGDGSVGGGMATAPGRAPAGRQLGSTQTISVLDLLQREPSADVLNALGSPEGSLAEVLKRHVLKGAQRLGIDSDEAQLGPAEDTAVDLVGNLFDVMARDRPYGEAVKPLLGRMVMPFTKAAVMDPELFVQPEHPARRLLNTVSEACEDNLGESPQERELLSHVAQAVEQLNEQFDNDLAPFESIEQTLAGKMANHRKRVGLAERRAAESQRGQERLEMARSRASELLLSSMRDRSMPSAIRDFLVGSWQHHLTMVALRHPEDSPAWREAGAIARPWLDYCDMASLGEPVPTERLQDLRQATLAAMSSSGVLSQAADLAFEGMAKSLTHWVEPDAAPPAPAPEPASMTVAADARSNASEPDLPVLMNTAEAPLAAATASASSGVAMPLLAPADPDLSPAQALDAMLAEQGEPPSEDELAEMRALPLNCWLQLPKSSGEMQVVKLSWVSGISGLMMFVNRRGARVLVASPAEMVLWNRQGRLLVFDRHAPVDQAMAQVVDRLRRQVLAQ